MPGDVNLWIIAVIAVAVIVAVALYVKRNVDLKVSGKGLAFRTSDSKDKGASVSVAEGADVRGDVGRVVGRSLGAGEGQGGDTEVGKKMKIGGSVDEIIGVETGRSKQQKP